MNWERRKVRDLRVLDFDIENRPLSYWVPDRPSAEITAIAWSFVGSDRVECKMLNAPPKHLTSAENMLKAFVRVYRLADVVTGHYIRKHDLPIINGALFEYGMEPLGPKLASDTKLDLVKWKDLPASQENLADLLELNHDKEHMTQFQWRDANRQTPSGLKEASRRVKGDVVQHKALRAALIDRGWLGPPRVWRP